MNDVRSPRHPTNKFITVEQRSASMSLYRCATTVGDQQQHLDRRRLDAHRSHDIRPASPLSISCVPSWASLCAAASGRTAPLLNPPAKREWSYRSLQYPGWVLRCSRNPVSFWQPLGQRPGTALAAPRWLNGPL